jgi:plasmid stabilization system protein ParE
MVCEIIWTPNAQSDFEEIVAYIENEWSLSLAKKFSEDALKTIELLEQMPLLGRVSKNDTMIRKLLISRHISLYYSVQGNIIFLLDFFDNRQYPSENPFD